MKYGRSNDFDSEFKWWVLPDKPHHTIRFSSGSTTTQPDWAMVNEQSEYYRNLLGRSCKGKWMETNHRYFFELDEDYEMFIMMCSLTS